ncbi:hypothetical protein KP509_12G028900 [Ceratopteris richardii]|uniref:FLZ-type domain-containing protein n=1 Tax=Ceratopteris richardii TaxID=49495 RepID=A0A8T2TK29_CERRI|nr:hypothetical protein KP509_12G028900 [Ceratopteris richardii]
MCGGIREFEILRSAASVRTVVSQFQQETKPSGYGYDEEADDADFLCYISSMDSWIPTLIAEKDCIEKKAAPAGLALAASIGSEDPFYSPAKPSLPRIFSVNPQSSVGGNQKINPYIPLNISPTSARVDHVSDVRQPSVAAPSADPIQVKTCSLPIPRNEQTKKKSIFYPAFSPRDHFDTYVKGDLYGDFMSACFYCGRRLGSGTDIYMYRGDRAFCSSECRYDHMLEDDFIERMQNQTVTASKGEPDHCTVPQKISAPSAVISVLG